MWTSGHFQIEQKFYLKTWMNAQKYWFIWKEGKFYRFTYASCISNVHKNSNNFNLIIIRSRWRKNFEYQTVNSEYKTFDPFVFSFFVYWLKFWSNRSITQTEWKIKNKSSTTFQISRLCFRFKLRQRNGTHSHYS